LPFALEVKKGIYEMRCRAHLKLNIAGLRFRTFGLLIGPRLNILRLSQGHGLPRAKGAYGGWKIRASTEILGYLLIAVLRNKPNIHRILTETFRIRRKSLRSNNPANSHMSGRFLQCDGAPLSVAED
jgi:hypothetical protein